jgi:parvulin-like peptidyl-prolyl isomerase
MRFLLGSVLAVGMQMACSPRPVSTIPQTNERLAASWDGGFLSVSEVRAEVQKLTPALREQFESAEGHRQFVEAVLAKKLLFAEGERRKIPQSDAIANQVNDLERRLSIQELMSQIERTSPQPDVAELKKYFDENPKAFKRSNRVHVSRLLASKEKPNSKKRAEQFRAKLLKGESMESLAPMADGPERVLKGDIGWFSTEQSVLALEALKLKADQVSQVFEGPDGFMVLKCTERIDEGIPNFDEVKNEVEGRYQPIRQRKIFDSLVKQLRESSGVLVNDKAFEEKGAL